MLHRTHRTAVAALSAFALISLAACTGGDDDSANDADLPTLDGAELEVAAVWSGAEQEVFEQVLDRFEEETGASVSFTSTGDDIATVLNTRLQGGSAPDVAILPQPGLLQQFAQGGSIMPLEQETIDQMGENYADIWSELGSHEGEQYGVWVDASNKSTVWYNTESFEQAGVDEPDSWDDFLAATSTLSDSGVQTPIALAGADGWTLTDWFENLYLRLAGADKYDQLTTHDIPWTDESVVQTLELMKTLFEDPTLVGDPGSALQRDFPSSVTDVFGTDPSSAIVYEGSFVAGVIGDSTDMTVGENATWFPFPSVEDSPEGVVGGGDVAVKFNDDEGTNALMTYLASTEAAELMVSTGSFTSANQNLSSDAYPDDNSAEVGQAIVDAGDNFRFDMSDLAPAAFGATVGAGEWKILQDFLRDPSDPAATAQQLEDAAAQAYG